MRENVLPDIALTSMSDWQQGQTLMVNQYRKYFVNQTNVSFKDIVYPGDLVTKTALLEKEVTRQKQVLEEKDRRSSRWCRHKRMPRGWLFKECKQFCNSLSHPEGLWHGKCRSMILPVSRSHMTWRGRTGCATSLCSAVVGQPRCPPRPFCTIVPFCSLTMVVKVSLLRISKRKGQRRLGKTGTDSAPRTCT